MEKIFYIAQLLGAINTIAVIIISLSIFTLISLAVWYFMDDLYDASAYNEKEVTTCKKWIKTTLIVAIVSALVLTFVPSKQTYLFMVGGNALEEIAKNEKVQERASKTIDLLDQYLEKKVKDTDGD
jgi:hypothetical protein